MAMWSHAAPCGARTSKAATQQAACEDHLVHLLKRLWPPQRRPLLVARTAEIHHDRAITYKRDHTTRSVIEDGGGWL